MNIKFKLEQLSLLKDSCEELVKLKIQQINSNAVIEEKEFWLRESILKIVSSIESPE